MISYSTVIIIGFCDDTCTSCVIPTTTMHRQPARARDRAPGLDQALPLVPAPYLPDVRSRRPRSRQQRLARHATLAGRLPRILCCRTHVQLTYSYIESYFSADAALLFRLHILLDVLDYIYIRAPYVRRNFRFFFWLGTKIRDQSRTYRNARGVRLLTATRSQ